MHFTALFLLLAAQPGGAAGHRAHRRPAHHVSTAAPAAAAPAAGRPAAARPPRISTAPSGAPAIPPELSTAAVRALVLAQPVIRGVHLTSWGAGAEKSRREIIRKISGTVVNAVVIAVKETDGKVYIPGVQKAEAFRTYTGAINKPGEMLRDFKQAGLYTVARIVVFKDQILPKERPELAVREPGGGLWRSSNGATWMDPYNREVWAYILDIAERCAQLGFDEIQFDYIRYPSEGNTSLCRYSKQHNRQTAAANLGDFLAYARKRLAPHKVHLSADVFGLTTSASDDMGIGQDLRTLAAGADYVYPMMYPSHYGPGCYGLKNPNASPFPVINHGLKDALARLGEDYAKVRPYLQDFSLFGVHYGPQEVRAQLIAAHLNMLESWVLWNPANKYTWDALTPRSYRAFVDPDYRKAP